MPIKITGLIKLDKKLRDSIPNARSNFAREMKGEIVDIIVDKITSGNSPVSGQNRYKPYSKEYSKKKGRKEPVDLVSTGKMLESLKATQRNNGNIILEFIGSYANKLATYHHFGMGNLPERKILPMGGDTFKKDIIDKITSAVRRAVKKAIR